MEQIGQVSREHQDEVFACLSDAERAKMAGFLRRVVAKQGLTLGVHPALKNIGSGDAK